MIGLMLPFFAVGMYEKDGQPLEKIIFHYVRAPFPVAERPTVQDP